MMSINIHFVQSVEAKYWSTEKTNGVDLRVKSGTKTAELNLYFDDAQTARAYADAINAVKAAPVEQQVEQQEAA